MPSRALLALAVVLGLLLPLLRSRVANAQPAVKITLGASLLALDAPWRFHIGDDPRWSDPDFDDSSWEVVDLTPPPGAHDPDVGLTGYVPGWGSKGHPGVAGFGWYRMRVSIAAPVGFALALAGPPAVDSGYQVFDNGRLLGSAGDFAGVAPVAYSIQPRVFALPESESDFVIAFRVWMGVWAKGDPAAGGIHIAPLIGERSSIEARYRLQWLETLKGYVVDVVEPLSFLLLAWLAWGLQNPFGRSLPVALVLLALVRANQAVFFWGQFEPVRGFEVVTVVLLTPLVVGAWTLAWRDWFQPAGRAWIFKSVAVLVACYMGAQLLGRSWFGGVFPQAVGACLRLVVGGARLLLLALTAWMVYPRLGVRDRDAWRALPALLLMSTGLFARELSYLGVPGIWFPFGTGVSRTQFAYAGFAGFMFVLFWRHMGRTARIR